MVTKDISNAAVEINCILKYLPIDLLRKIPEDFKRKMINIESKDYEFKYDKTKKLNEQQLLPETKGLIALIYREFICDKNEKKEYIEECKKFYREEERKKFEKYNPNEIFKNKNNSEENCNIINLPDKYKKKENLFIKILRKLKGLFK